MRITSIVQTFAATTALAAGLGLAAAPVHAESQTHKDPRGDVTQLTTRSAARAGIDVVSLKNTFKGEKLSLSMTSARLLNQGYRAEWVIVTPDHAFYAVFDHSTAATSFEIYNIPQRHGPRHAERGSSQNCPDARTAVRHDSVVVALPRYCIADAKKVRIGGVMVAPGASGTKIDDSRHKGQGEGSDFTLGPVLKRN